MKFRKPDYYSEFKCIADKCPETCCSGWAIVIDDKSMHDYKTLPKNDRKYVMNHVDTKENVFKQNGCRCSFLNDNGLCDMYTNIGEEHLCKTCTRYPRHFEEYGNLVEAALSISCPVVAERILSVENANHFRIREDDRVSPHRDEVDEALLRELVNVRKTIFEYVKEDTEITIKDFFDKIRDVVEYGKTIQKKLYEYEKYAVDDDGKFIASGADGKKIIDEIHDIVINDTKNEAFANGEKNGQESLENGEKMLEVLQGLEKINDSWEEMVDKAISTFDISVESVDAKGRLLRECKDFDRLMQDRIFEYKNIFVYYIYTYFLGAVYDFNMLSMVKMAQLMVKLTYAFAIDEYVREGEFTHDDMVKLSYTLSRQIEHSDENLSALEGLLTAHPAFAEI